MDCVSEKELCSRFSISSYPTIYFKKEKNLYLFNRKRDTHNFIEFSKLYHTFDSTERTEFPSLKNNVDAAPPSPQQNKPQEVDIPLRSVFQLTDDNLDLLKNGKTYFVKFYAPVTFFSFF